jgi:hypothetical protein
MQSIDAMDKVLDESEQALRRLEESLNLLSDATGGHQELVRVVVSLLKSITYPFRQAGIRTQSMRGLKQLEWQSTILSTVRYSLRNYRSTLLRITFTGQAVGLPNIELWMSSGFSGAINYAYVRKYSHMFWAAQLTRVT